MNTTLTATWFTPEQAEAFGGDADITILFEEHDEQATYAQGTAGQYLNEGQIYAQGTADQYGDEGRIAGAVTDADEADDILRAHGLRRTGQWTTQNGYSAAPVETL